MAIALVPVSSSLTIIVAVIAVIIVVIVVVATTTHEPKFTLHTSVSLRIEKGVCPIACHAIISTGLCPNCAWLIQRIVS